MKIEEYEKLLKFLEFKMTLAEMEDFKKELQQKPELMERVLFEQSVRDFFADAKVEKKIADAVFLSVDSPIPIEEPESLMPIHKELEPVEASVVANNEPEDASPKPVGTEDKASRLAFSNYKLWLVAASIIVVVGVFWLSKDNASTSPIANNVTADSIRKDSIAIQKSDSLKQSKRPAPPVNFTALFEAFYKKEKVPATQPMLLADALMDYDVSAYKTLQNLDLETIPVTRGQESDDINNPQNVKEIGHYYRGISFIETRTYSKAIADLDWIVSNARNGQLVVKAQWYLGLIHVKSGNINKSLPLLTSVANSKAAYYNGQAQQLLQVLKP